MRFYDFDARYATEVAAVLDRLRDSIRTDEKLSDGDEPFANGFIPKDARVGRICILVGELPGDVDVSLFPQVDQPAPLERSA